MRPIRLATIVLGACALAGGLASCGGSADDASSNAAPPPSRPADFPRPAGKTLGQLKKSLGAGPSLAPATQDVEVGRDRFGFALFDRSRKQITDVPTALYAAPVVGKTASGGVVGPFLSRFESLAVKPQFQSETVKSDPDAARSVYVSQLDLPKKGTWALMAVARLDDRLVASEPIALRVGDSGVPRPGDRAIKVNTPTVASVGGDVSKIDTRKPPGTMHDVNFADVVGKKPVVLLFATPALCQSRVCGPVVDIAEQLKAKWKGRVDFIHQEIYNDNELSKGFRPQVTAWHLPSEPWLFVIGKDGRVTARFSGPFSASELNAAIQKAV